MAQFQFDSSYSMIRLVFVCDKCGYRIETGGIAEPFDGKGHTFRCTNCRKKFSIYAEEANFEGKGRIEPLAKETEVKVEYSPEELRSGDDIIFEILSYNDLEKCISECDVLCEDSRKVLYRMFLINVVTIMEATIKDIFATVECNCDNCRKIFARKSFQNIDNVTQEYQKVFQKKLEIPPSLANKIKYLTGVRHKLVHRNGVSEGFQIEVTKKDVCDAIKACTEYIAIVREKVRNEQFERMYKAKYFKS